MTAVLYGIKNCDTVKKARAWLDAHHIEYHFHDFRSDGIDLPQTQSWLQEIDMDTLINKRGTTWKQLDDKTRTGLTRENAAALIIAQPTLIKRPLLDIGHQRFVGFSETMYRTIFKLHTL